MAPAERAAIVDRIAFDDNIIETGTDLCRLAHTRVRATQATKPKAVSQTMGASSWRRYGPRTRVARDGTLTAAPSASPIEHVLLDVTI